MASLKGIIKIIYLLYRFPLSNFLWNAPVTNEIMSGDVSNHPNLSLTTRCWNSIDHKGMIKSIQENILSKIIVGFWRLLHKNLTIRGIRNYIAPGASIQYATSYIRAIVLNSLVSVLKSIKPFWKYIKDEAGRRNVTKEHSSSQKGRISQYFFLHRGTYEAIDISFPRNS